MPRTPIQHHCRRLAAAAAACCASLAFAATGVTAAAKADAQARYQNEVQACKSGRTAQDSKTCLTEARNALAARQKGQLATDDSQLRANATQRCKVFEGEAKAACIVRMSGHGDTSGSVAGGGILREVETVVVRPGTGPVRIEPRTADPVILVPMKP